MSTIETMRAALRNWDRHRTELAQLSIAREGDWRRRTVQYRRLLQTDIAQLATAAHDLDGEREHVRSFRDALSALRSRVAVHQATWPVVAIDPDDAGYERSVTDLRAEHDRFAAMWADLLDHLAA